MRYVCHGGIEDLLVVRGRLCETGDLADVLKGGSFYLLGRGGDRPFPESLYRSTHVVEHSEAFDGA